MGTTDAEIHFALPFDHTLFVEPEVLGAVRSIDLLSPGTRIEFPRDAKVGSRGLEPPVSAPDGVSRYLPNGHWGIKAEGHREISIEVALVVVPVTTTFDFELGKYQVGGEGIRSALEAVIDWFDSFSHWLWVLTAQSLDPINPDPKVIHRRSRSVVITASAAGQTSLPAAGCPGLTIIWSGDGPASERLVNTTVLDRCVLAAGSSPPLAVELLASARMAARRSDHRRALIDAGTAAEAGLSLALGLGGVHQYTLGGLVTQAEKRGLNIPADARASLVDPRNDAVHRGGVAPGANIARALEVAEDLVAVGDASLIRVASLNTAYRPQRHDLVIIRGPAPDGHEK